VGVPGSAHSNPSDHRHRPFRSGRSYWGVLAFLLLFAVLLFTVSKFFLLPALPLVHDASRPEKLRLMAYSRLLLAIVLLILIVSLILIFRPGRFFFPRRQPPRESTKYIDMWAEAGRRMDADKTDEP
jgi:uncharacterized BrkB/YihY/UPF0761 family membrane protein